MGAFFSKIGTVISSIFIDKLLSLLGSLVKSILNAWKNRKKDKVDDENQQNYDDTLKDPTKTEQDIDNATDDFLNGNKP